MKITEQDINKLKKIGLITSTYPSKKIIEDLELDTVDLNKIFKYITHVDSTEKIEQWLSEEPGPTPPGPTPTPEPLTFNIKNDGYINWICMAENGATIEYSKNGGDWISITAAIPDQQTYKGTTIDVESGDVVKFRGDNPRYALFEDETPMVYGAFDFSTCEYDLSGNILSLINSTNYENITTLTSENTCAFMMLFGESPVVDASKLVLPATTLADNCYHSMFYECTSLTTAPELLATTLAEGCYREMFRGCTALTIAPKFSATTLANYCCISMFQDCTSLTTVSELPATTLAESCYERMFSGCTALTTAPELPATTLVNNCYNNMFSGCTALTTAPELPATTLAEWCYSGMFYNCTALTTVPAILPATTLAEGCYQGMFTECRALTTAPELPATTLADSCYYEMFHGCRALTTSPELPATVLVENCYYQMFYNCISLNRITCLATNIIATGCTSYWVMSVPANGVFIKNASMPTSSWGSGESAIPSGWTVESAQ